MKRPSIHPKSFRHQIKDSFGHYFNENHLLGVDPFDHSKFKNVYKKAEEKKTDKE